MSFLNASRKIQLFARRYANTDKVWGAIPFLLQTSAANTKTRFSRPDGTLETFGNGTFLFAAGKKRTIQMNYFPVQCDVAGSIDTGLCDSPDVVDAPAQIDFTITQSTASKKIGVQLEDIRKLDNGFWDVSEVAMEAIASRAEALRKVVAVDWLTYLATKSGVHTNGNSTIALAPAYSTEGAVNPLASKLQIDKEYIDIGVQRPHILGGNEVYYWKELLGLGGQQNTGIQTNKIDSSNVYYDDNLLANILDDETNGGWMYAISPSMFKLVTYNKNAGIFRTDLATIPDMDRLFKGSFGEGFILGTYLDEATGLLWDLDINFEKCPSWTEDNKPGWSIQLKLYWDMFVMPPVACAIEGFNGITVWRTCPEKIADCPDGRTPSPAIEATNRSWTPGAIFPIGVYQSTIGGQTVTQNNGPVALANLADMAAFMNDATGGIYDFVVSGSTIRYSGVTNISVDLNNGEVTGTFA